MANPGPATTVSNNPQILGTNQALRLIASAQSVNLSAAGDTASGSNLRYGPTDAAGNAGDFGQGYATAVTGTATSGTWRHMGGGKTGDPCGPRYYVGLWCRVS
jgi:hypothetical protein